MANPEHVDIVKRGAAAIKAWREKHPSAFRQLDLRKALLRGADMEGANLAGADLCLSNLWGVVLTGANLSFARLIDANVVGQRSDAKRRLMNACSPFRKLGFSAIGLPHQHSSDLSTHPDTVGPL